MTLAERRTRYAELSSKIAYLDDTQLQAYFEPTKVEYGWGKSQHATIDGEPFFIKRIPVTDVELKRPFSTKNHYNLPPFYQYRLGSVGFGCYRELLLCIKTSNWVLAGEMETFPLLLHYRIIRTPHKFVDIDLAYHKRYVTYWGGNENIGRYLRDRANATYQLILCLEHIPHTVADWLNAHPTQSELVMSQMLKTLHFLRQRDILHFDMHFANILTDGTQPYLTDFGLGVDSQFALNEAEVQFFEQHQDYDVATLIWSLSCQLYLMYRELSEQAQQQVKRICQLPEERSVQAYLPLLLDHSSRLAGEQLLPLNQAYLDRIVAYRPITDFIHRFYATMRDNEQKNTPFDHQTLNQLLTNVDKSLLTG